MSDCPQCKRRLGAKTSCRCGYVMLGGSTSAPGAPPVKMISCCIDMCHEGAICRIFTDTGWANVCRSHYPSIARAAKSYSYNSAACAAGRKAYEGSYHYRQKHGGASKGSEDARRTAELKQIQTELEVMKRRMEESAPTRVPGQDDEELPLGIARDPLEQEFSNDAPA